MDGQQNDGAAKRYDEFFGEIIFSYSDREAIEDGVLVPFVVAGRDTGHRITRNAYEQLKEHYEAQYPEYGDRELERFFLNELLVLAPEARRVYARNDILTTNFDFAVGRFEVARADQLWYVPNELMGVTMMLPEDY